MLEKNRDVDLTEADMKCCTEKLRAGIRDAEVNLQNVEFRMAAQADDALKAVDRVLNIIREQL